jgi:hypothetical protein
MRSRGFIRRLDRQSAKRGGGYSCSPPARAGNLDVPNQNGMHRFSSKQGHCTKTPLPAARANYGGKILNFWQTIFTATE